MPNSLADQLVKPFPTLAAYLNGLPSGLKSFPECQMLADGIIRLRMKYPGMLAHPGVPLLLRQQLSVSWKPSDWIPYVQVIIIHELLREFLGMNEVDYLEVAVVDTMSFLERPAYRSVCRILSPHLLLAGFSWRWNTFTRGLLMHQEGCGKNRHMLSIRYPPGLLLPSTLNYYARLLKRLLIAARADKPRVILHLRGPGQACYEADWQG